MGRKEARRIHSAVFFQDGVNYFVSLWDFRKVKGLVLSSPELRLVGKNSGLRIGLRVA